MPQLKLSVHNNPLECTCDMLWMKEWINDDLNAFYHWPQVNCKFPKRLCGRTLANLNKSELNCTCDRCQQSFKCFSGEKTCNCASEWAGPSCCGTCQFHNDSSSTSYEMMCSSSQGKCFCSNMSEVCVDNAQLIYSNLTSQCVCKPGFQGDGLLNCSDINECAQAHSVCDNSADCFNTEGSYRCFCPNGYQGDGVICQSIKHHNEIISIVTTTFSVLVFVVLIGALGFCIVPQKIQRIRNAKRSTDRKRKRKQSTRRYVDLYKIHELGFTNNVCTQEECIKDDEWEIPREKLHIFAAIGEGAFGVVMEGSLDTVEGATKVAVKTLKPGADRHDYKDLMAELSIMKQAGSHPNIVSLLGACSVEGPLYLVMEFVSGGNLLCFLRKSRCQHPHYINISSSLNERELLKIAKDVADGMTHLSDLNIVHRDLAARNILLTENKIAKVTDFGLARDLQSEGVYTKTTTTGRLPVKWMAPESIRFHVYTSKSDVWSYGVLLWEIISIGQCPYPGIPARLLMRKLMIGYRMQKPSQCSDEMYEVMRACWQLDASARPTFAELANILHEFLARTGRAYINLEGADSCLEQIPTNSFDLSGEFEEDELGSNNFTEGSDDLEYPRSQNDLRGHSENSSHTSLEFQTETIYYVTTKF
ncbi:Fibroblast growth factor receptor 1 [Stylophora pistillata]|uniref:receptor protein-tyrosine kinase n=2 Tax=Stylophora pistillata TaxID=50429 RepID=A0A2B4RJB9_STYPI|nr:Fibroblast growth factor receptor 1 [Stylophora pistillata]